MRAVRVSEGNPYTFVFGVCFLFNEIQLDFNEIFSRLKQKSTTLHCCFLAVRLDSKNIVQKGVKT